MTGGTVTASSGQHFGYSSDGTPGQVVTLNMSGGLWNSTSDSIHFGSRESHTANINLSGYAEMKVTSSDSKHHIIIGGTTEGGTGKANVTMTDNSLLYSSSQIFIGNNNGGVATVTMDGSSRMQANKIVIGRTNGTATVTLSGDAEMASTNGNVIIGENGNASLTLNDNSSIQASSGNTVTIGGGWDSSGSHNASASTVTMNDNSSISATGVYLGMKEQGGTPKLANEGHLVLNGGTITTSFIRKGRDGAGAGEDSSIIFNGGKIIFETGEHYEVALFKGFTAADLKVSTGGLYLEIVTDAYAELAQGLTGNGALTKTGNGVLKLGASGAFTGDVIIEEGGLILQAGAIKENALLSLATGTSLDFDSSFLLVVSSLKLGDTVVGEGVYTATDLRNIEWNINFGNDVTIQVIPEPSTYALAFAGAGLAVMTLRRRKRRSDLA